MTEFNTEGKGFLSVPVTGTTSLAGGALCSLANPFGKTAYILRAWYYAVAASTGAANINCGVGATATTDASDLLSAVDAVALAAGTLLNTIQHQETNETAVTAPAAWTSTSFVNVTGSASTAGLAGTLYLEYLVL